MKARFLLRSSIFLAFAAYTAFASAQDSDIVVRSRITIPINLGNTLESVGQSIELLNAPYTSVGMTNADFRIPPVRNAVLDLGFLRFTTLFDNNLKVCGRNSNQRCNTALIRTYTMGVPGPGVYNLADSYGMPLIVGTSPVKGPEQTIGLGPTNAVTIQSIAINPSRHTVTLEDFGAFTKYAFKTDFTDAGAGCFSTTLVIEYALAP